MNNLEKIKTISEGHFSNVFLVADKNKQKFVLKEYTVRGFDQSYLEYLFLNSINLPNVVKPIKFETSAGSTALLLEYIEGSRLDYSVFKNKNNEIIDSFFLELTISVAKVHLSGICINDIKPDNIIVQNDKPFLIDFGLATLNGYADNVMRGTIAYSSPEKIKRFTNHFAGEIFSLGVLYFYLKTGKTPADDFSYEDYKELISDQDKFSKYLLRFGLGEFVEKMLSIDPGSRPSMTGVINHFSELIDHKKDNSVKSLEIQSYIFPSQIKYVKNILKNGTQDKIRFNYFDEPEKIINLLALWTESSGKRLLVIDESKFIADPEIFFNRISGMCNKTITSTDDLVRSLESNNNNFKIIVLKYRHSDKIEFLENVYKKLSDGNLMYFIEDVKSDLENISKEEYEEFLLTVSFDKLNIKMLIEKYIPKKPYLARLEAKENIGTAKKKKAAKNKLTELLRYLSVPVSYGIVEKIYGESWSELLNSGLINNEIELINDKLKYSGPEECADSLCSVDSKILKALKQTALEIEDYLILGKIAVTEGGDKNEILDYYEKYIQQLSDKELYFSAYEFANWLKSQYDQKYFKRSFDKKFAFLARVSGYPEVAIKIYNELEKGITEYESAVISSDKAVVLQEINEFDKALECYEKAVEIFKKEDKINDYMRTLNNQGSVLYELKKYREAEKIFNILLLKAQQNKKDQFVTMSFLNLAAINVSIAEWKKALHFSTKAREIAAENNKLRIIALSEQYMSLSNLGLGNYEGIVRSADFVFKNEKIKENRALYLELLNNFLYISIFAEIDRKYILKEILKTVDHDNKLLCKEAYRELFFNYFNEGNLLEAVTYYDMITDTDYKNMLSSILEGNIEKIIENLNFISVSGNSFNYLYYSSHILRNKYLEEAESLRKEINSFVEITPFYPVNNILKSQKEYKKYSGNENTESIWNLLSYIHSNLEFDETMNAVLLSIIKIADLDRAVFFKFSGNKYIPAKGYNKNTSLIDLKNLKISTSILKDTIKFGEIRFLSNLQEETDFDIHSSIFGLGLRSAICYPLFIKGEIKGVFYADTTGDKKFSDEEKKRVETILIQATSALKKSEAFEEIKKQIDMSPLSNGSVTDTITGNSEKIRKINEIIATVGEHNVNVLITGPTGSGKELIARTIHKAYGKNKPMVSVNCTAIPESLMESELFGYVKGAFTGADNNKKGKIEEAGDGILFMDEIGDMPMSMQAKLLRVLQERVVSPVGSSKEIKINARFIAATNKDLTNLVKTEKFREDLLYRLKVVTIDMPSLNERKDDIPLLINDFIVKFNKKFDKKIKGITSQALSYLVNCNWKGNIRQLENIIEKAVIFSRSEMLDVDLFEVSESDHSTSIFEEIPSDWSNYKKYKESIVNRLDKKFADKILKEAGGNIKQASENANLNRRQLYRIKIINDKKDT